MFLNLVQLAESFGVSEKVIDGWVRYEGLPNTPDRGRLLFDRAQVAQWAATRGLATKAGFLAPDAGAPGGGLHLEPLLRAGGIWRNVPADEVSAVVEKVVGVLPGVTGSVGKMLAQRLGAQGGVTIAPVGGGFALPHPSKRIALGRESGTVAMILLREPLVLTEPQVDDVPVTILLFFIAPSARTHLELLGRLSRLLSGGPLRELVNRGADDEEIYRAFAGFDAMGKIGGAA
ncbi:MAG: PTS sugar transporter subunit IIA [Verrucomicrobiae bacterium]